MNVEELTQEAERLSIVDRGNLVARLLEGLGNPDYDVSDEEVAKRIRETEDGSVQDISHEELVSRLKYVSE